MVQKEVKKKTQAYGLMAILLASMCVAIIYTAGTGTLSPSGPGVSPNPTTPPSGDVAMRTFGSYDELKTFLETNSPNSNSLNGVIGGNGGRYAFTEGAVPQAAPTSDATSGQMLTSDKGYSSTNVQVAGVDEADNVKTDGHYIYTASNDTVFIIDANPSSAKVLQKIQIVNSSVSGIYLSSDGNRLVVLGNDNMQYYISPATANILIYPYYRSGMTFAYVYDVANKNVAPVLDRNLTMSGSYLNSRVIGDYLYNMVTEYTYMIDSQPLLPAVYKGAETTTIPATDIYYSRANDSYGTSYSTYSYTTFLAIDLKNNAADIKNMTIILSGADQVYVSEKNIYVTYPVYEWNVTPIAKARPPAEIQSGSENNTASNATVVLPVEPVFWGPSSTKTTVYRIHIDGPTLTFAATGNVTGTVLNQYSMDESNGYFRMATNGWVYDLNNGAGTQENGIYVLNMNLEVVGKVDNIAPGESFHAARFMGDRCYLVTFNQVDPLFVVDLASPSSPQVLGNLTIPGYSDYLYPYDATHLIGLGKDVNASIDANLVHTNGAVYYTAVLGLKLSLFDVSDVHSPREISKLVIGDRGTESPALTEAHAFLFDPSRNLLVLPVNLYLYSNQSVNYTKGTFSSTATPTPTAVPSIAPDGKIEEQTPTFMPDQTPSWIDSPQFVWQGVYAFRVTLDGGFQVLGNVTQLDNAEALMADPSLPMRSNYQWVDYHQFITRAMYIDQPSGTVLYTFSDSRVQLNSLDNFALLAKIDLK
jgi:inhibitor of cysteine peptidase